MHIICVVYRSIHTQNMEQTKLTAGDYERMKEESFERSDTDGALTQWALGINAQKARMEAELESAGNVSEFPVLCDLSGNEVPAKVIAGKYGTCWMLLDASGKATGQFAPYRPARASTLAKRGFQEVMKTLPAKVEVIGTNYFNCHPFIVRA